MSFDGHDYIRRLTNMVDALKEAEGVRVTHFAVQPGATPAEIEAAEQALGRALPTTLRALYEAANGVQLLWTHEDHLDFDPDDDTPFSDTWLPQDSVSENDVQVGAIALVKLEELVTQYDWIDPSLWVIDTFNFYNWSAVEIPTDDDSPIEDPFVRVGDDHNATFEDCRPIRLSSYLELVLTFRGSIAGRREALTGYNAASLPELVHAPAPPLPLDEILTDDALGD